jgi:hypothetical protein
VGVGSSFLVFCTQDHFQRYRGRRVKFSCFALTNKFLAVPMSLGTVFMFCAVEFVSIVPRTSCPIFLFCTPELVFGGLEGAGSNFCFLCSLTRFRRY